MLLGLLAMFAGLDILQAIQGSVEYSTVYLDDLRDKFGVLTVLAHFGKVLWSCWILVIGALVYSLCRTKGSNATKQQALLFVSIALVLAIVIKVLVGRKLIHYYYFPLFGYLAIVVVFISCLLFRFMLKAKRWAWVGCSIMLATLSYNAYQEFRVEKSEFKKWQAGVCSHQGEYGFRRKRWSWSRHLRGFDRTTMPDIVVARSVADVFEKRKTEDRTLFTYGSRAWIHVFADSTSPTKYCYVVGFLDRWSSGFPQRTKETIEKFRQTLPQVIVQWFAARPPTPKGEYRPQAVGLAAEFEKKVLSKYELIDKFTFSNSETYPYKSHTAHVYQLRESEAVRVARNPKQ